MGMGKIVRTLLSTFAVALQLLLAGCVTGGGTVWTHESDPNDYYWHQQRLMDSPEEAIGAIKNLQPYFVEYAGWDITSLDIDKYGLRASGTWSETNTRWVPSSGGFFAGNTYVPVYGGSTQAYATTKQESFAISFNDIKLIWLIHYHTIDNPFKWGVIVAYNNSTPPVSLRVRSKDEAKRLISAFETLAVKQGYKLSTGSLGLSPQPLTPEQSAELGLPNGIGMYCQVIFKEGPFEKAGLRKGDVVVSIDNHDLQGVKGLSHARGGMKEWVVYRSELGGEKHKKIILKINTDVVIMPAIQKDPRNPNGE